jgi:hypothetical protein
MIPTRIKSKLPKTLSYPLGAEAISKALADAPHAAEIALSFLDFPVSPASEFQRRLREESPYRILVAQYVPAHKPGYGGARSSVESGWFDAQWSLYVYPVLRELRHTAEQLLREQGLPVVVEWLRGSRAAGWDTRAQRVELVFSPVQGVLLVSRWTGV